MVRPPLLCGGHAWICIDKEEKVNVEHSEIPTNQTVDDSALPDRQLSIVPTRSAEAPRSCSSCSSIRASGEDPVGRRSPAGRLRDLLRLRPGRAGQTGFLRPGRRGAGPGTGQRLQEQRGPEAVRGPPLHVSPDCVWRRAPGKMPTGVV